MTFIVIVLSSFIFMCNWRGKSAIFLDSDHVFFIKSHDVTSDLLIAVCACWKAKTNLSSSLYPFQSSPSLTILVSLWLTIKLLGIFYVTKPLLSGFLQVKGNWFKISCVSWFKAGVRHDCRRHCKRSLTIGLIIWKTSLQRCTATKRWNAE